MTSPQNSSPLLTQAFSRSPRMVSRRTAGEYILVPILGRGAEVDAIFNLNGVAAFIWEQFDGRQDGHRIVTQIAEQFDVDHARAEADYLDFVGKLLSVAALVEVPGSDSIRSS
jgi:hypothetical protein